MTRALVTGGTGFLGAGLVASLVRRGYAVRVFDNNFRGHERRLAGVRGDVELIEGDIRDADAVDAATRGMDWVFHLAFVNGTRHFYEQPGLVLDVGVRGALTTMDAAKNHGVVRYILASSSEVYQEPTRVPTDETERIFLPDVTNPRFSYSGGKLISELLALHYLPREIERIIFRPHNVYGPDMGNEHVIPEFMLRAGRVAAAGAGRAARFPIQGSGAETRAFCYVDDAAEGIVLAAERGHSGRIYHVGVDEETSIADLAQRVGRLAGLKLEIEPSGLLSGSTPRRCPDIGRLRALGYEPRVSLDAGLERTWPWYRDAAREPNGV